MRRSKLFTKTRKEAPADEVSKNAQLLIRAGFIYKEMAGVYSYLPLGKNVLDKTIQIIREEMDAIGGQELYLSALQPKETWEKSGRWKDEVVDVWFKTRLHGGKGFHTGPELGLGNTHEEALTLLMQNFVSSYKDLPVYAYQFQTKFRNEPRAKSGLLRCREFIMKDLYSFCRNESEHEAFYAKAMAAYKNVFERIGLGDVTYLTLASGGSFTKGFSHEFQTVTDVGEDTIFVHEAKKIAINQEVLNEEALTAAGVKREELVEKKAIEVGNIFPLGTKYAEQLGLIFTDQDGSAKPAVMGSYGIGPGRLVGTIVEHFADEKGLVWPRAVAPFDIYLACIGGETGVVKAADEAYARLTDTGFSVLYDDREARAGEMFADADLLGFPYRLVISAQTVAADAYELKERTSKEVKMVNAGELEKILANPAKP